MLLFFLVGVGGDIPWMPEMKVYSLCQIRHSIHKSIT